ncbi:MAG: hypothetical protein JXA44_12210 [Methanospirillaceae archaeon]|nr:hypothetical protein [Methanospirillaceae archaeon]
MKKVLILEVLSLIGVVFLISAIAVSGDGNTTVCEEEYACNTTDDRKACNQSYFNCSVSEPADGYPPLSDTPETETEDTSQDIGERSDEGGSDAFSSENSREIEENKKIDPGSDRDEISRSPPGWSEKSSGYDFIAMSEQNTAMAQKNQENAQLALHSSLRGRNSGIGINIFDAPRPVRLPAGWGCGG